MTIARLRTDIGEAYEHTLLPPGLVGQHGRGWAAIARQLADELTVPAPPPRP